jgi:DNA-binding NtrC family response regulator
MSSAATIQGLSVLLLEDDPILRKSLADLLDELGCNVIGPFSGNQQVLCYLAACAETVDVGILDVLLGHETCLSTASEFDRRSWPFIFISGVPASEELSKWADRPHLDKPFGVSKLEKALQRALDMPDP